MFGARGSSETTDKWQGLPYAICRGSFNSTRSPVYMSSSSAREQDCDAFSLLSKLCAEWGALSSVYRSDAA